MAETAVAKTVLWGAVWIAWSCYGIAVLFTLILIALKDPHKRNWIGSMALAFAILATTVVFSYYSGKKYQARTELLKMLYLYPEVIPYHEYGEKTDEAKEEEEAP
jgi:hypothetical protein